MLRYLLRRILGIPCDHRQARDVVAKSDEAIGLECRFCGDRIILWLDEDGLVVTEVREAA